MPLSDIQIRSARASNKARRMHDEKGLYLEISPAGGKWWRLKYRFDGKEKRISLGVYPETSLREARARRDEARKLIASSVDPSNHRRSQRIARAGKAANSFQAVTLEWFEKYATTWAKGHADRVIRLFERDIFPALGKRSIDEISAPELLEALRVVEKRGALDTTHRALGLCGKVFRYAIATGRTGVDPSSFLRGAFAPTEKTRHFAAVIDPKRLGEILRHFDHYDGTLPVTCALRLAPLLFVRPGELRRAEWSDIYFDRAEWRYVASKTNPHHIVPLSRQSLSILSALRTETGKGKFLFPSARNPRKPMSDNAVLLAMRRMGIEKHEVVTHGFRATARTLLVEQLSQREDIVEHQLAHRVKDPNGRAYNRTTFLAERKGMMQLWADYLDDLKRT